MFPALYQKFGQAIRNFLPVESALVLLVLGIMVWPIPFAGSVSPSFILVAIYYWAIYRPDLFRPLVVFILGLLNDAIHFLPVGLSAFIFLGVYQLAFAHRRYFVGQVFLMLWFGFSLLAFLAMFAMWSALSLFHGEMMTLLPVLVQYGLTVALFPLPAWGLIKLQRTFLSHGADG